MKLRPTITLSDEQYDSLHVMAERSNRTVGQYIECLSKLASKDGSMIFLDKIGEIQQVKKSTTTPTK